MSDTKDAAERHSLVGPSAVWEVKRDFQIRFLKERGLLPRHFLVDIGCGTLRGGIPLIRYLDTGHYYGLEVRAEVVQEARQELAEHGLDEKRPMLRVIDRASTLDLPARFDYAWAFSVLIHMDDETLQDTMAFVRHHLASDGVFLANVKLGEHRESAWQRFPLVTRPLAFYEEIADAQGLRVHDLGTLRELGHDLSAYGHVLKDVDAHHNQSMLEFVPSSAI